MAGIMFFTTNLLYMLNKKSMSHNNNNKANIFKAEFDFESKNTTTSNTPFSSIRPNVKYSIQKNFKNKSLFRIYH